MGRTRYKIYEPTYPHFVTCTILHWLPIFTRKESFQIVIDTLKYLQQHDNLKLHAFVILENHLHMIVSSSDLHKSMQSFKQWTAKEILKLLKEEKATTILDQLAFYKKSHRKDKTYQVWEEGYQPKLIKDEKMLVQKINYIHNNPIKRGFVEKDEHWLYSSARDYIGNCGFIKIDKLI